MDVRYFCAPRLRKFLDKAKPLMFAKWGESPSVRPLTVQTDLGVAFDFNMGLRLRIPEGNWHVKIFDDDSGTNCFDEDVSDVLLISLEKFFVNWAFMLWRDRELVFEHRFDAKGRYVYFCFIPSGMGDRIVMFPYAEEFRKKWGCKVACTVEPYLRELFGLYYPNIEHNLPTKNSYATYFPAPGFNLLFTPEELRKAPMEKFAQQIFGLPCAEKIIYRPTGPRQIKEPYVCIAAQASTTVKSWLNPYGWALVVEHLKQLGYRVLCIDRNRERTNYGFTVKMPEGAEDFTGDLPLIERVNLLAYADFFIGMPSGLSWLAWAADVPAILISGITPAWYEFATPYRVINRLVCFGCHNDLSVKWPEFLNCPKHKGTDRAYECSRKISGRQVIQTIDRLIEDKRAGRFSYPNFL